MPPDSGGELTKETIDLPLGCRSTAKQLTAPKNLDGSTQLLLVHPETETRTVKSDGARHKGSAVWLGLWEERERKTTGSTGPSRYTPPYSGLYRGADQEQGKIEAQNS